MLFPLSTVPSPFALQFARFKCQWFCRGVQVFYSIGNDNGSQDFHQPAKHHSPDWFVQSVGTLGPSVSLKFVYVYVYVRACVCACVCVEFFRFCSFLFCFRSPGAALVMPEPSSRHKSSLLLRGYLTRIPGQVSWYCHFFIVHISPILYGLATPGMCHTNSAQRSLGRKGVSSNQCSLKYTSWNVRTLVERQGCLETAAVSNHQPKGVHCERRFSRLQDLKETFPVCSWLLFTLGSLYGSSMPLLVPRCSSQSNVCVPACVRDCVRVCVRACVCERVHAFVWHVWPVVKRTFGILNYRFKQLAGGAAVRTLNSQCAESPNTDSMLGVKSEQSWIWWRGGGGCDLDIQGSIHAGSFWRGWVIWAVKTQRRHSGWCWRGES